MSKLTFVTLALLISNLTPLSAEASPSQTSVRLYSCTAGLNDQWHNQFAVIDAQTPNQTMDFGYGITSRLSLLKSGALGIEVLRGSKVVSSMVMKPGVLQLAMTAGGIEMNCFPRFNADYLR